MMMLGLLLVVASFWRMEARWRGQEKCKKRPEDSDSDSSEEKFLVVLSAREGMNKNVAMIAEAAQWALEMNRTFVEPAVCDSRVVSPFEEVVEDDGSGRVARYVPSSPCRRTLGFSEYWDLDLACEVVPLMGLQDWLELWDNRGKENFSRAFHTAPKDVRIHAIPKPQATSAKVLFVDGWFRSVQNPDITEGYCTSRPCMAGNFRFPRSSRAGTLAKTIFDNNVPEENRDTFTCVQWRSETKATSDNVQDCARFLVASTNVVWNTTVFPTGDNNLTSFDDTNDDQGSQRTSLDEKNQDDDEKKKPLADFTTIKSEETRRKRARRLSSSLEESQRAFIDRPVTFLVTDLKANTSKTFKHSSSFDTAFDYLQTSLGLTDAKNVISLRLDAAVNALEDQGMQSLVSQDICAAAPVLIMCMRNHGSPCTHCARGLDSGFVSGIFNIRQAITTLSTNANEQNGVWEWPETS